MFGRTWAPTLEGTLTYLTDLTDLLRVTGMLEEKWLIALTEDTVETDREWRKIRDIIKKTYEAVLGTKIRTKQKEWISDATLLSCWRKEGNTKSNDFSIIRWQNTTIMCADKLRRVLMLIERNTPGRYAVKLKMQGCRARPWLYMKESGKLQGNMRHRSEQSKIR